MADLPVTRRVLFLLPGTFALVACGFGRPDGSNESAPPAVRTDREPLTKRFPALGDFVQAHWQGWAIGDPAPVPGPTDIAIQALVTLRTEDLAAAKSAYDWQPPASGWEMRINKELQPFAPAPADWRYNRRFELAVKTDFYGGQVRLDVLSGTVFLNVTSM